MRRLFVLLCTLACTAQALFAERDPEVHQKTGLGYIRERRQAQEQQPNYRPYSQAPAQIKNLLQYQQAREPIVNIPSQPVPSLVPGQGHQGGSPVQTTAQASGYRPNVQFGAAPQQPTYGAPQQPAYNPQQQGQQGQQAFRPQQPAYAPQQPPYRPRPQQAPAPQYRPQQAAYNPQQRQGVGQQQPNYRAAYQPTSAPQGEQTPHYSKNIPPAIQQLIQAQQNQQG